MAVAGQRRGAPGSVVVDSKAAPHSLHAARLLYGNRDLSGTRPSSWRDVYGGRTASPMTRTAAAATARKKRHFRIANSAANSLPVVKSVVTSSSGGALTADRAFVDAQSSRKRRGGNRKRVRGSPDSNDADGGQSSDATHDLHRLMQHAVSWDSEFCEGSQADFRDDRDRLLLYGSHPPGSRLPVLSTLGSEINDCGASVDTADTRPLHSRGNSKARRRNNTRGTGSDSTKRDFAVGRPAGREPSAPDGGWSMSRTGQTETRRQQLAEAEKEAVITRMLQTFSAPSDGKSTHMSDFVNMVSELRWDPNELRRAYCCRCT